MYVKGSYTIYSIHLSVLSFDNAVLLHNYFNLVDFKRLITKYLDCDMNRLSYFDLCFLSKFNDIIRI